MTINRSELKTDTQKQYIYIYENLTENFSRDNPVKWVKITHAWKEERLTKYVNIRTGNLRIGKEWKKWWAFT